MSSKNFISIASGGDDAFAMPTAVALYSILRNYKGSNELVFYILDGGMSGDSIDRINRVLEESKVVWIKPDMSRLSFLPKTELLNEYAYMRLLLPEVIDGEVDSLVYVDADTVTNVSIDRMLSLGNSQYVISAVRDYGGAYASSTYALKRVYKNLDISPETPMFNSGVMIINVKLWKKMNIFDKCIDYLTNYSDEVRLADQEALNVVINGNWYALPWKWNVQVGALQNSNVWENTYFKKSILMDKEKLLSKPSIAHFIGGRKPWIAGLTNPCRPLFTYYLRESGWFSKVEYSKWYTKWLVRSIRYVLSDIVLKIRNIGAL